MNIFLESLNYIEIGQTDLLCEILKNNKEKLFNLSKQSKSIIHNIFDLIINQKRFMYCYTKFLKIIAKNKKFLHDIIAYLDKNNSIEKFLCLHKDELFETKESFNFEPYVYHTEILIFFNNIIEKDIESLQTEYIQQNLRQYMDLTKILKFLCRPDIFSPNQRSENSSNLMLTFILKEQLIRLISNIWLNNSHSKFQNEIENNIDYNVFLNFLQIESDKIRNHQKLKRNFKSILQNQNMDPKKLLEDFTDVDVTSNLNPQILSNLQTTLQFYCNRLNLSKYNSYYHYYQLVYFFPLFNAIQKFQLSTQKEQVLLKIHNSYLLNFKELIINFPEQIIQGENPYIIQIYQSIKNQYKNYNFDRNVSFVFDLPEDIKLYTFNNQKLKKQSLDHQIQEIQDMIFNNNDQKLWKQIIINIVTNDYVYEEFCHKEQIQCLGILAKIKNKKYFNQIIKKMLSFIVDTLTQNYNNNTLDEDEKKSNKTICLDILFLLKQLIENAELLGDSPYIKKIQHQNIEQEEDNIFRQLYISILKNEQKNEEEQLKDQQNVEELMNYKEQMRRKFSDKQIIYQIISNLCIKEIDEDLFYSHIDLLISILEGGNQVAQELLYSYFITHQQTEEFFERIEFIINDAIINLDVIEDLNTQLFRSIDHLSDQNQKINDNQPKVVRLIRFLQLLAEGHFNKLQRYISEQPNLKKSIDLLSILVQFAEQLLKNLSEFNYYILVQVLDTLIEFIQGPCYQNQLRLSKSRLLHILLIVLENYESVENSFIDYYQSQIEKQDLEIVSFKTNSLFHKNEIHKNIIKDRIIRPKTNKIIQSQKIKDQQENISLSQDNMDQSIESCVQFINKAIKNCSPSLSIKIIDILYQFQPEYQPWMIRRLQNKILILLDSIIEGVKEDNEVLKILDKIPINILLRNLSGLYTQYKTIFKNKQYSNDILNNYKFHEKKPSNQSELILENGFRIFGLLQRQRFHYSKSDNHFDLQWIYTIINEENLQDHKNLKDALKFFQKNIGYVEIFKNNQVFGVYFPKPPCFVELTKEIKQRFIINVDRSSHKSKLQSLMQSQRDIITDLKYIYSLTENVNFIIFSILARNMQILNILLFIICFIQNIIILQLLSSAYQEHDISASTIIYTRAKDTKTHAGSQLPLLLLIFECVQIFFSFLLFIIQTGIQINKAQISFQDIYKVEIGIQDVNSKNKMILQFKKYEHIISSIIKDRNFYIRSCYFVFSILGLYNSFFIAILLFDIFFEIKDFEIILLSIWRPIKQIIMLILVFLIFQYWFAIIIYYFFEQYYIIEKNDENNNKVEIGICSSLLSCFSMQFDVFFKIDGGSTGLFNQIQSKLYYTNYQLNVKTFFDFVYILIVKILLIEIIEGLIINTFAFLREENTNKKNDQKNYCFICGLSQKDNEKKEQKSEDFNKHVSQRHNMWNYLFYMSYIQDKVYTEYTGIESYVEEKLKEKSIEWFPIQKQDNSDYGQFLDESKAFFDEFQDDVSNRVNQLQFKVDKVRSYQLKHQEIVKNIKKQI